MEAESRRGTKLTSSPRIQVLQRAMALLDLFDPVTPELSLTEIAEALDMWPSSTYRMLTTLEEGGFVARNPDNERYRLGTRLLELAANVLADLDVRRLALPHLRQLVREFGESVSLGAYDRGEVVYLESVGGLHTLNFAVRVGARHPAHCVASGRSMLTHLPSEVERIVAAGLRPCSPRTIVDPERFVEELDRARRQGYAVDDGEFVAGLRAAASAILDHDGYPLAAIAMVGASERFSERRGHEAGRRLQEAAETISATVRGAADAGSRGGRSRRAAARGTAGETKGA